MALSRNDRPPGWYKVDLALATALALSIFKAEDRFLEVIVNPSPCKSGPIARRNPIRSAEPINGKEARS